MSILAIRKPLLNVIPFRFTILKATTGSFEIFNLGIWRPAGRIHRCAARENESALRAAKIGGIFFQVMPGRRFYFSPKKKFQYLFLENWIRLLFIQIPGPVLLFPIQVQALSEPRK